MKESLLTIEGKPITKLIKYDIVYTKSWADDAGRNMAGEMEGTLVGIFPTLQLEIGSCDNQELAEMLKLFNTPFLQVQYYDSELQKYITAPFYADDVTASLKKQQAMKFNAYQVNLHPIRRR